MRKVFVFTVIMCLSSLGWAADKNDAQERLTKSATVLQEIIAAPDKGIPEEVLSKAKCVAVVPNMVKGGLGFGGQHGRGVATCRTQNGWSAPAFFTLTGGSFGLQIGVEGVDLIMLAMNEQGMQALLSSKFKIGGDVSAAAGPVGRHAEAGTDWKLDTPILTYSRAKGVFAGVTINGSVIQQDNDATKASYGRELPTKDLLAGKVPPPPAARDFLNAVARAQTTARSSK
jgi:lipid-binding SYLF domain-containing protein